MTDAKALVTRLKELKGTGAWARIAKRAGIDYSTLARFASGQTSPRIDTCEAISQAAVCEGRRRRTKP